MDTEDKDFSEQVSSASGTAARMKRNLGDKAKEAKEALADLGQKAADRLEGSSQSTSVALERTATALHSGSDQVSGLGHSAAERLRASADYLRETDLQTIGEDIQGLVRRYPGPSLAAAAVLGFLIARGLRSGD